MTTASSNSHESLPAGAEAARHAEKKSNGAWWKALGTLAALGLIAFLFLRPQASRAKAGTGANALPIIAAAKVERREIARELVFDSELRPYQEVDVHAKVAGYVDSINVDVGDRVKEDQLLAKLELPEVQNDLERAVASQGRAAQEINRAQAEWEDAHLSLTRIDAIEKAQPNLIAQQEIDTATAKERSAQASLAAAREQANAASAEVKKLKTMLEYARITAPFDGVITRRYADKGALIQAGTSSSTQAMPLVRVSQNGFLRLVFPVSASYVSAIKVGDPVEINVPGLNKTTEGKITRSSQKIDFATRTMETEVDITNADYSLIPGMYASVRVKIDRKPNALVVPVTAVSRKGKPTVYLVNKDGKIEERTVKLGLETPHDIEIASGLKEGDTVMIGNRTGVIPGQQVSAKFVSTMTQASL
jgi:RND family efflux transporter MFP subunit